MRHDDWFMRVKVMTVQIASTIIFVALVCWVTVWELRRLFGR